MITLTVIAYYHFLYFQYARDPRVTLSSPVDSSGGLYLASRSQFHQPLFMTFLFKTKAHSETSVLETFTRTFSLLLNFYFTNIYGQPCNQLFR